MTSDDAGGSGADDEKPGATRMIARYPGTMLSQPNESLVLNVGLRSTRRVGTTTAISTGSMTTVVTTASKKSMTTEWGTWS